MLQYPSREAGLFVAMAGEEAKGSEHEGMIDDVPCAAAKQTPLTMVIMSNSIIMEAIYSGNGSRVHDSQQDPRAGPCRDRRHHKGELRGAVGSGRRKEEEAKVVLRFPKPVCSPLLMGQRQPDSTLLGQARVTFGSNRGCKAPKLKINLSFMNELNSGLKEASSLIFHTMRSQWTLFVLIQKRKLLYSK